MMARRDYICCKSCGNKLVYDGYDNIRESLDFNYGTVDLICPSCLDALEVKLAKLEQATAVEPAHKYTSVYAGNVVGIYKDGEQMTIEQIVSDLNTKAVEPAQAVPVAWKHDCAALLTNNVELWIDACPHCGKPRTVPPAISEPAQAVPVGYRLQSIAEFDAMNEWIMSGKHDQKAIDHDKKQKAFHFVRWIASLKTGGLIQARANDLLSMLEAGDEN